MNDQFGNIHSEFSVMVRLLSTISLPFLIVCCCCCALHVVHGFAGGGRKSRKPNKTTANRKSGGFGSQKPPPKQRHYIPDTSAKTANLIQFLQAHEAEGFGSTRKSDDENEEEEEDICMTEIGFSAQPDGLRGLYATKNIQPGEFMCAIPFPVALVVEDEDVHLETDAERGLAFCTKFYNSRQQDTTTGDGFWTDYLATLPRRDAQFDPTPDFFDLDDIEALELPRLVQEAKERKAQIEALTANNEHTVSLKDLQFATWIVKTRAFTTLKRSPTSSDELQTRSILIPYLDMINHSSQHSNAAIEVIETPHAPEESFYALQCTRPIAQGQEITIQYGTGEETCADFLVNYGFLPPDVLANDATLGVDTKGENEEEWSWSTSLAHDQEMWKTAEGNRKTVVEFRLRAKTAARKNKRSSK